MALALLTAAACETPGKVVSAHSAGDFQGAKAAIQGSNLAEAKKGNNDRFLWLMEEGKICQDAGDPSCASRAFLDASDWGERFAIYEPKTTIQEEAAAMVVNQQARVFRGTYSDRILVDAYATLSELWKGDPRQAAVFANRVAERQTDAEVEQQKQIEKVRSEMGGYSKGDVNSLVAQVRRTPEMQGITTGMAESAYLNPFASWISAVAWGATGDASNQEKANVSLRKAFSMMPGNRVLAAEVEQNPFVKAASVPQVLVLFEAGLAPTYKQLAIPLGTPWSGFTTIPLPLPDVHPTNLTGLTIRSGAAAVTTELLADNDAIFKAQYDRMLPEIVFRTAVMVGMKQGATVAATQATRNNSYAQIGVLVGSSLYQTITNQADLRCWTTPGKFIQIGQLDRPADGTVTVAVDSTAGQGPASPVPLPPGRVVMLYVRSVGPGATVIYPFTIMP